MKISGWLVGAVGGWLACSLVGAQTNAPDGAKRIVAAVKQKADVRFWGQVNRAALFADPAFQTLEGLQIPLVNLDPRPASAVALVAGALTGFDRDAVWPI